MFKKQLVNYFILSIILFFCFATNHNSYASGNKNTIYKEHEKFKTHILTLDYISRKTASSKFFLNMAKKYCGSLLIIGMDSAWAIAFKEKIDLTIATCEFNMNHKIQLFPYFDGFPYFYGLCR